MTALKTLACFVAGPFVIAGWGAWCVACVAWEFRSMLLPGLFILGLFRLAGI